MKTYNIETLTRHPNPPDTYETTFCGGEIIQTHETWQAAEVAALGILDRNSDGQTIYVTERGKDGAASPLIRWQCFRVWRGKKTAGDIVSTVRPFEILFDNGGGALLQSADYCHAYDDAEQLAYDVHAWLNGSNPRTWDGNQPEYRRDRHPEDDVVTSDEISRHLTEGTTTDHGGHMHNDFWTELHRLNTPDLASAKTASGKWLIFHRSQAGSPSAFDDASGLWYFEPAGPHGGDGVYSSGFPTREAAITAAEQWELDAEAERDQADVLEGR